MNKAIWFRCYEYNQTKMKFFECNGDKKLHSLVYNIKTRHRTNPNNFIFYAEFADGFRLKIPREVVAYPIDCMEAQARTFVLYHTKEFQKPDRCFYKDSFEEQVADFIATNPWQWKQDTEIRNVHFTRETLNCSCGKIAALHPVANLYNITNYKVRRLCSGQIVVI